MLLWRISRHQDLSGNGGLRLAGRWHHAGRPVVYLATTPAAALLEVCVHTSANDIPPSYTLLKITAPDDLYIETIQESDLTANWRITTEQTRNLGTQWLENRKSALLEVPSALVPETFNVLFNPLHPLGAGCRIISRYSYPFDQRLKR